MCGQTKNLDFARVWCKLYKKVIVPGFDLYPSAQNLYTLLLFYLYLSIFSSIIHREGKMNYKFYCFTHCFINTILFVGSKTLGTIIKNLLSKFFNYWFSFNSFMIKDIYLSIIQSRTRSEASVTTKPIGLYTSWNIPTGHVMVLS